MFTAVEMFKIDIKDKENIKTKDCAQRNENETERSWVLWRIIDVPVCNN